MRTSREKRRDETCARCATEPSWGGPVRWWWTERRETSCHDLREKLPVRPTAAGTVRSWWVYGAKSLCYGRGFGREGEEVKSEADVSSERRKAESGLKPGVTGVGSRT